MIPIQPQQQSLDNWDYRTALQKRLRRKNQAIADLQNEGEVTAMLVSSLTVVGNSLRLRGEKGEVIQGLLHLLVPWREAEVHRKEGTVA